MKLLIVSSVFSLRKFRRDVINLVQLCSANSAIRHTTQEYQTGKLRPTASLLLVQAVMPYKDVPKKETAPMQYFNKLEFRVIPTFPLFTSKRSIHNSNVASSVIIHRLIKNATSVTDHDTDLKAYITKWAVSKLGNIFFHKNNPYFDRLQAFVII
ncbi:hypothetical protein T08_849 [Trichinella sp. T8]|nr:hypothetical protein T08_849 [Trichinella sp. T8]